MDDAAGQRERARDFERFLTFVDAIVAIAVTLLVLPLVDLVGRLDDAGGSVGRLLADNEAPIGAFFLSFVVIARLWLVQHELLRNVVATNRLLTNLLLLWSLTIVLLPFPTALVSAGGAGDQAVTKVVYVGTMAVGSCALGVVALVVAHDAALRDSTVAPDPRREFAAAATFVLALLVMLLLPVTSYFPLLLLAFSDRIARLLPHRLASR